jgi:hypothetical protein
MVTHFWSFRAALPVFLMFNINILKVFYDTVLNAPLQKVQLGARRREPLKIHALCSAKRIKKLFGVAVQARLVGYMDREHLTGRRGVRDVVRFGVVRHEPLEFSKGNALPVAQNIVKFFAILWYIKEFRDAIQKNL